MKKYLLILLTACLCLPLTAQTEEPFDNVFDEQEADTLLAVPIDTLPYPQYIQQRLDSIIGHSRLLKTTQLGLMVYDLDADTAIYVHNHRQTMRPASTMKIVTAVTALDKLGGNYQLRTSLYYMGKIEHHVLTGNLVCVGGMDPAFNVDDMAAFVESVRQLGVDTIQGRILADRSFKDGDLLGEGWCWDDDNPQLSPLLVGKKDNFVERFAAALKDQGIVLVDTLLQPTMKTQVCTRSHTIDQVLGPMMKDSNNLFAESLYYQLASSGGNRPAKASHARQYEQQLIQRLGLNPADYKLADGSGLSLYNYVSPELLVRLLRFARLNANVADHLLPALPIAAVDGTLKGRMAGNYTFGNVQAKTGTLTGISSLAGYCTAAGGHHLCFAIINQGVLRAAEGRTFQDRVCEALCTPSGVSLTPPKPVAKPSKPRASVKSRKSGNSGKSGKSGKSAKTKKTTKKKKR